MRPGLARRATRRKDPAGPQTSVDCVHDRLTLDEFKYLASSALAGKKKPLVR
jgi:hypothetical protein